MVVGWYGRKAVIPTLAATNPKQTNLIDTKDLTKAMTNVREDVKDRLVIIQQCQKT